MIDCRVFFYGYLRVVWIVQNREYFINHLKFFSVTCHSNDVMMIFLQIIENAHIHHSEQI